MGKINRVNFLSDTLTIQWSSSYINLAEKVPLRSKVRCLIQIYAFYVFQ